MYGDHQFQMVKYRQADMEHEAAANHLAGPVVEPVTEHRVHRLGHIRAAFAHVNLHGRMHLHHGVTR